MKFKKNKNVNTIEYFASCMCKETTCYCVCFCNCAGDSGNSDLSQSDYGGKYDTGYNDRYATNLPTGNRSYL